MRHADQVVTGLWQGDSTALYSRPRVDLLVGCAYELDVPRGPWTRLHCKLDDDPQTPWRRMPAWRRSVRYCAQRVAAAVDRGERVLVCCHMGWNRSGLITALALRRLGYSPRDAIQLVRDARGEGALCNRSFVEAVRGMRV